MKRGPIKVVVEDERHHHDPPASVEEPETVTLPTRAVIDAGVAKFMEYANLHWPLARPTADEAFKLQSFDYRNTYHLRVTLGMVYQAMREADDV